MKTAEPKTIPNEASPSGPLVGKKQEKESFFTLNKQKPFFSPATLQAKLEIGQPNDKYEQEADQVADTVMRMPDPSIQRQPMEKEGKEIQTKSDTDAAKHSTLNIHKLTTTSQYPVVQRDDSETEEAAAGEPAPETEEETPNITIDLPTPMHIRVNGVMYTSPTFLLEGPNGSLVDLAPYTGNGLIDFPLAALESLGIPILSFYHFHFGRARQYLGQDFEHAYGLSGGTSFIRNALHYGYISAEDVELYGAPSSYRSEHYEGLPDLNIVANPMDIGTMINVSYFNNPLGPYENNPTVLFTLTAPFDQNPFEAITNLGGAISHALSGDLYDLPDVTHNYPGFQSRPERELGTPTTRTRVSPKESDTGPSRVTPQLEQQVLNKNEQGQSLTPDVKEFMENRFGSDFTDVNIHTGSNAIQLNRQLGSRAFTVGNDIYFNKGEYSPHFTEGKHLLAHELTHVIQQGAAGGPIIQKDEHSPAPSPDPDNNSFNFDFELLPPALKFTIGNWMLQANTGSAELQFSQNLFRYGFGYNYGGNIFAGLNRPGFGTQLGVDPTTGATSLNIRHDQFRWGGSYNPGSSALGLSFGYGAPLLPMPSALSESVYGGWAGASSILGDLGNMQDPISFYQSHSNDIDAVMETVRRLQSISDVNRPSFGAGLKFNYNPNTGILLGGGMQWHF